ncbi:transposase, partial [Paracoccus yeei]|uniref:transposase n=1 Tax=Paracoccus yeei TaxID=147645 RepID=UPI0012DBD1AC
MKRGPWPQWGRVSPDEQIIGMLQEQEAGMPTAEVCRRHGLSPATFYKLKPCLSCAEAAGQRAPSPSGKT